MPVLTRLRAWLARSAPEGTDHSPLGTPSHDPDEAPPGVDQEANAVVSGGGSVTRSGPPRHKARRSR